MDYDQFKLFKKITLDYFDKLAPSGESPVMEEPYLQFGDPVMLDFTSLVNIQGEYRGCIYLTAPSSMIEKILEINGEHEFTDRTRYDMSRELSNVLAGNASHAFGGNWEISVPLSLEPEDLNGLNLPASTFIMPFTWRDQEAYLVVGLAHPAAEV